MTISNGIAGGGFEAAKPAGKNNVAPEQYAAAPNKSFPASDKSSQGNAGLTNKMVHSVEATREFGAGN